MIPIVDKLGKIYWDCPIMLWRVKRGDSNAVRVVMKINVEENTNEDDTKISDVHKE